MARPRAERPTLEDFQAFRRALIEARKRSGLSQSDIEARSGGAVSQSLVSQWEDGTRKPQRPGQVFALEKALGLSGGALSAYLGYLPTELFAVGIEAAIALDDTLDDFARQSLLDMVARFRPASRDVGDTRKRSSK
jgi:transcriptional regulator with XRE-family HTH domain